MNDGLRELIREMIRKELEEISSTASCGGAFMTPKAFAGEEDEDIIRKKLQSESEKIDEGRGLYHVVRDQRGTPARKIGLALTEVTRKLHEIERLLSAYAKLKTEHNLDYTGLWKRTSKHISLMERKILSIAQRLKELKS